MLSQSQIKEAHKEAHKLLKRGQAFNVPTVFEEMINKSSFPSINKLCKEMHEECRNEMTRQLEAVRKETIKRQLEQKGKNANKESANG